MLKESFQDVRMGWRWLLIFRSLRVFLLHLGLFDDFLNLVMNSHLIIDGQFRQCLHYIMIVVLGLSHRFFLRGQSQHYGPIKIYSAVVDRLINQLVPFLKLFDISNPTAETLVLFFTFFFDKLKHPSVMLLVFWLAQSIQFQRKYLLLLWLCYDKTHLFNFYLLFLPRTQYWLLNINLALLF